MKSKFLIQFVRALSFASMLMLSFLADSVLLSHKAHATLQSTLKSLKKTSTSLKKTSTKFFGAAKVAPASSSSPSSSSTPIVEPALELSTPMFHMGEPNSYASTGFSGFERTHRWTEGKKASISISLKDMEHRPSHISFFDTRGLVFGDHTQELFVRVNGKAAGHYVYTPSDNDKTIQIALPPNADRAKIKFEIPNAASPLELGIGADKRKLGIMFREVQLQTPALTATPGITPTLATKPAATSAPVPVKPAAAPAATSAKPASQDQASDTPSANPFITRPLRRASEASKAPGGEKVQESETTSVNPWGVRLRAVPSKAPAGEKVQAGETTSENPWGVKLKPTPLKAPAAMPVSQPSPTPAPAPAVKPVSQPSPTPPPALAVKPVSQPSPTPPPALAVKPVSQPTPTAVPAVKPVSQPSPTPPPALAVKPVSQPTPTPLPAVKPAPASSSSTSTPPPAAKPALQFNTSSFHMGESSPFLSSGFSAFERSLRWTEGNKASITIPLAEMASRPSRISFFNTGGFVTPSHEQELIVKVNGKEVGHYVYSVSNNNQTIDIDLPQVGRAKIKFEIPNAASPLDLRIGADKRKLGISFREVQLQTPAPTTVKPAATTPAPAAKPVSQPAPTSAPAPAAKTVSHPTPTSALAPAVKPALELDSPMLNTPMFHMGKFSPFLSSSSGFSAFESSHRWTEGKKATITIPLAEMASRPSHISFFNTQGLVTGSHPQDLIVKVNGEEVGHYVYTLSDNNQRIDVPLPKVDLAKIKFEIPNAASPFELGIGADKRKLGILFREVQFQTPAPAVTSAPAPVKSASAAAPVKSASAADLTSAKPASQATSTPSLEPKAPSITAKFAVPPIDPLIMQRMQNRRGSMYLKNKKRKNDPTEPSAPPVIQQALDDNEEDKKLPGSSPTTSPVSTDMEKLLTSVSPAMSSAASSVAVASGKAEYIPAFIPPPPPLPSSTTITRTMSMFNLRSVQNEVLGDAIKQGTTLRKIGPQSILSTTAEKSGETAQIKNVLGRSLSMMRLPVASHSDSDDDDSEGW